MVHKGLEQKSSAGLNSMFEHITCVRDRNTRAAAQSKLMVPNTKLHVTEGNFRVRGAKGFNLLPPETRNITNTNSLKPNANNTLKISGRIVHNQFLPYCIDITSNWCILPK